MTVNWLWRAFLRLYPREHREQFGAEMTSVFASAANERRGWLKRVWFCVREIAGLIWGATAERFRRHSPAVENPAVTLQTQIEANLRRMEHAIANHQFDKARFYSYYDLKLRELLRKAAENRGRAA